MVVPIRRMCSHVFLITLSTDVGFVLRKTLASTKPDIEVEVNGDHYVITTITTFKTIRADFKLGQTFRLDPGTGREATVKRSTLIIRNDLA
jgi:hypothetical protein